MERFKKLFAATVMVATVLSMTVVAVPNVSAASAGDLIKMNGLSSVYYLAGDGKRYVFPNEATFFSWYDGFGSVKTISQSELEALPLGANVTIRPGTKLVKITTNPKVYAVESSGSLVAVPDEATATTLFGANWAKRVVDVPDGFFSNYKISSEVLTATAYPEGSLIKTAGDPNIYYIAADGKARKVATEAAFNANRFNWNNVITTTLAIPVAGTDITGVEAALTDTSSGAGGTIGAGSGLTVALASDTPASATTLSDTLDGDGSQALIPVTKINFTASSDGDVKVTTLKLKRAGVPSTDSDFTEFTLFDGNEMLAKYNSISDGILTFTNASGLFTVSKGTTKAVTLKVTLDDDVVASRAYSFGVLAAADVVTDGAQVSGSFPMTGNSMTTALVDDLGKLTLTHSTNSSAPDPGTADHTLWKFTAAAADQDIDIERLKFTVIGTVDVTDINNFKIDVAGTQIGSTVTAMGSDKTITFDFATPYRIPKGNTKTITLKGNVVGGTSRTYQVYLYNREDIMAKDVNYGAYLVPNQADTYTKVQASAATTINAGALTVSKSTTSPTGNVPAGGTGVEIAKFDFKATGESVKVDSVWMFVNTSSTNDGLRQVKLYVDGSQVGTATNLPDDDDTEVAMGNAFIIPAGTTKSLVVKADMKEKDGTANLAANETIAFQLGDTKSTDYTKQASGGTSTTGATPGNTLTVKTGTLVSAKNTAFANRSVTNPTGVVNAAEAKIASFTLTAGSGEGVTISQISLADYAATTLMGNNFQNLKLKNGTTQLGNTIANLNASSVGNYDFSPSPAIVLTAGQQYVVDVYADIKGSATQAGMNMFGIKFAAVSATGNTTSADASENPADYELQTIYISSVGNLNVSDDTNKPVAQQLVMGSVDQEVAKFKLEASTSENLNITGMVISDQVSAAATGTLANIKIYDGTTLIGGPVQLDTTSATTTYAHAVFNNLNFNITAGQTKTITVKADVGVSTDAVSGSTHTFGILVDNGTLTDEPVTVKGVSSGTVLTVAANTIDLYSTTDTAADVDQVGNTMTVYRTKVSAAFAGDTPTGAATGSSAQTVAKINITNSANAGGHTAIIKYVNLALSTTISNTANRALNVYKDNTGTTALATTSWLSASVQNFGDTAITDAGMTDVEIAPGETKLFIFTLDTTDGTRTGDFSLSVGMAAGDIGWDDSAGVTITTVNSLPLESKTLTY